MKHAFVVCLSLCLTTTFLLPQSNTAPLGSTTKADPKAQAKILDSYAKLPLSFEANRGQSDAQVKFLSRTVGYTLFLTGDEAVLALNGKKAIADKAKIAGAVRKPQPTIAASPKGGGVLRMKLRNANPAVKVTGVEELAGTSNYFVGNDPAKWRTNVPTYAKVKYEGIYSGIDLVYYGNQRQLEYDFIVGPGANPHQIAFDVHGAKRLRRDGSGDLVFKVGEGEVRWHKPVVYQEKHGARQEVAAHYAVTDTNRVGFEVAKYDASRPLYIDPLIYSTYLGASGFGNDFGIAADNAGNAYVTGRVECTYILPLPVTPGAFQTVCGGNPSANAFVTKFNPTGSALVYSTYLSGSGNANVYGEFGNSIAVDSSGDAYVTGVTGSTDFPVTPGAFQTTLNGELNAFVTELNPSGSALLYSTYLGGSGNANVSGDCGYATISGDCGNGIAVDSLGDAYVTGYTTSTDFPVTPSAFQTVCGNTSSCENAFVTEINPTGSALVYSTYLGGGNEDYGNGIAVDSLGDAYVTGDAGAGFPTTPGAFQTTCCGAFVTEINPTGSALVYSTYLGGSGGNGIAVDNSGSAYVTGVAYSDFPTTPGAFQTTLKTTVNAFVTKMNAAGSALVYSTYLGGSSPDGDQGYAIAVDSSGNAYVTGLTNSSNFPTENPVQKHKAGHGDAFVTKLNPSGSALVYSTYLGGSNNDYGYSIAVDSSGNAYVTGTTYSPNFPVTPGAFQTGCDGASKGYGCIFVAKIVVAAPTTIAVASSPNPSTYGEAVAFTAVVTSTDGAPPDGESVSFMKGTTVLGTGTLSGGTASFTTSTLPVGMSKITAVYSGDLDFSSSTSKAVKQVVKKAGE